MYALKYSKLVIYQACKIIIRDTLLLAKFWLGVWLYSQRNAVGFMSLKRCRP